MWADLVPRLRRVGELDVDDETAALLLKIAPATIDRRLAADRAKLTLRWQSHTKPGAPLKDSIPIRTWAEWDDAVPGFVEIDLVGHEGHRVSQATVLRLLRDDGLILPSEYQKQRRELAKERKAASTKNPTGPNQVWQLDFSEFETTQGGTWRIAGCRDWYSKVEHPFHVSPTANQCDAIVAI
ncbi:hypothetical protein ABH903_003112 [Brevibacterium epidermidis]|uniref:Transposase n=1 Tax=Brevibacterium epidermidis TaxID=1698 RepID=A0ABV4ENF2_BREEP